MIRQAMKEIDMPVLGALYRNEELHMPERHLGLLPAEENTDREIVEALGNAVAGSLDLEAILHLACLTPELLTCEQPAELRGASETVCRIGIARDEAFSFYYPASLKELESLGAELVPFSPLHDKALPDVDGLFIGGGFPEMFAEKLSGNEAMRNAIRAAAEKGMPIYAECGGYMYLMQELQDFDGRIYPMCGVFAGKAAMTRKLQMVGYVDAVLQQATILGLPGRAFMATSSISRRKKGTAARTAGRSCSRRCAMAAAIWRGNAISRPWAAIFICISPAARKQLSILWRRAGNGKDDPGDGRRPERQILVCRKSDSQGRDTHCLYCDGADL